MAQRLKYGEIAPEGMATMRAVEHFLNTGCGLEASLLELVRLRASMLNGCEYCVGLHTHELTKRHEPEGRISEVAVWRESEAYTLRERAALAWTEAVTNVQLGHVPDVAFVEAREHFAEPDLVNLTIAIASINAWNRIAIAFRVERQQHVAKPAFVAEGASGSAPEASSGGTEAAPDDDGGKVTVED